MQYLMSAMQSLASYLLKLILTVIIAKLLYAMQLRTSQYMGELKNILLDWCNKPRNIDKFLYNFNFQNNYSSSKCLYLHVCTTAIVNITEIRGNIPSSLLLQSRYVQPPTLVRINKSNFCQMWQNFPNPFLPVLA